MFWAKTVKLMPSLFIKVTAISLVIFILFSGYVNANSQAIPAGTPVDAPVDFNGDGRTDYAVTRTFEAPNHPFDYRKRWFYNLNNSNAPTVALDWGIAGDYEVAADYDGDGKDDIAVWRIGDPAYFYILNSATNTLRTEQFGQRLDDPTVVADYNGDGKDDLAVYRPGVSVGDQSTWFYRATPNGAVTYIPWGVNGDHPNPGDFDGNGSADFCIWRGDGSNLRFWTLLSTGTISTTVFGLFPGDQGVTGDFDGDRKNDYAVLRRGNEGTPLTWFWRPSGGAPDQQVAFGLSPVFPDNDVPVPGDYDGDGKTDIAVWRVSLRQFIWRGTASGAVTFFQLGGQFDIPVAYRQMH